MDKGEGIDKLFEGKKELDNKRMAARQEGKIFDSVEELVRKQNLKGFKVIGTIPGSPRCIYECNGIKAYDCFGCGIVVGEAEELRSKYYCTVCNMQIGSKTAS